MGKVSVRLEKQEADFHFRAFNADGHFVDIDDATAYEDGKGHGVGPMQMLVMAIGGCSGVDIVSILKKGRQEINAFHIDVTGTKPDGVSPSIYEHISVVFHLEGTLEEGRVKRAVELSIGKYCSVARTLEKSATIEYGYSINGTHSPLSMLN